MFWESSVEAVKAWGIQVLKEDRCYGILDLMLSLRAGLGNSLEAAEIQKSFKWVSPAGANMETKEDVLLGGRHYGTKLRHIWMEGRCSSYRNGNVAQISKPWEPSDLEKYRQRYAPGVRGGYQAVDFWWSSCCVTGQSPIHGSLGCQVCRVGEGIMHKLLREIRRFIGWTLKESSWGRMRWLVLFALSKRCFLRIRQT